MNNCLILHGTSATPQSNWFSWLEKKLIEKDWQVWLPQLPNADNPTIQTYTEFLLSNKDWKFNPESTIIGHSSGAVAILGLLQNLPEDVVVDTCILVGSFKDDLGWESLQGLFIAEFDFEKIKKKARQFIFIHSDNDPYCPLEHAQYLCNKVDGKLIMIPGAGHFNVEASEKYREFPEILKYL
jgi:uncharacterized protein